MLSYVLRLSRTKGYTGLAKSDGSRSTGAAHIDDLVAWLADYVRDPVTLASMKYRLQMPPNACTTLPTLCLFGTACGS